jgi:hypothetical protein
MTLGAFVMLWGVTLFAADYVRVRRHFARITLTPGRLGAEWADQRIAFDPSAIYWVEALPGNVIQLRWGATGALPLRGFSPRQAAELRTELGLGETPGPVPQEETNPLLPASDPVRGAAREISLGPRPESPDSEAP